MSQIKKKFIENNAIDNSKLDQSSSYDFATNNGTVKVKTPTDGTDAVNKDYIDTLMSGLSIREVEDLTYTDTTNKVIALAHIPTVFEDVLFFAYEGSTQEYNVDFSISVKDDVAYICLASDSTPPSGGSWDTENLPTTGVASLINSGEGFTCEYLYNGSTLASPSVGDGAQGPQGTQGPNGADGTIGVDGVQGPQGTAGLSGADGQDGVQGSQGVDGAIGPQGPAGEGAAFVVSSVSFTSSDLTDGIYTLTSVKPILPTILTNTNEQVIPDSLSYSGTTYTIDLNSFNIIGTWIINYIGE